MNKEAIFPRILQVLTLVGGAAGLVYCWDRFVGRRRFMVRVQGDEHGEDDNPVLGGLQFEIENVG